MKKVWYSLLLIIIASSMFVSCNNETPKPQPENPATDFEYEINEDNTATITKYIGSSNIVVIPQKLENCIVTWIGGGAFAETDVERVDVPDTVEVIDYSAFHTCASLAEIKLSKSLKLISIAAFCNCDSLQKIDLSMDSLEDIAAQAFYECDNLQEVVFGDNITAIGFSAFQECTSLEKVELPRNLIELGESAFKGCISLESVFIPKTLSNCGMNVFFNNSSLDEIIFEEGIEKIGEYSAFANCDSLEKIVIPASAKFIGMAAFAACDKLREVYFLGNMPEEIGEFAFGENKEALKIYYNPNSDGWDVTKMKEYNFNPLPDYKQ